MFHKEGFTIIITTFIICTAVALIAEYFIEYKLLKICIQITAVVALVLVLQFFRNPSRNTQLNEDHLLAPVVVAVARRRVAARSTHLLLDVEGGAAAAPAAGVRLLDLLLQSVLGTHG